MKTSTGFAIATIMCFVSAGTILCQSAEKGKLHTPAEILKIMEESKIMYQVNDYPETEWAVDTPTVLSNRLYLKKDENGFSLYTLHTSDEVEAMMQKGEEAFRKKDWNTAVTLFSKAAEMDQENFSALTLVGDTYFNAGRYDSAIVWFKRAIQQNFVDYDAHWFLADAYSKCDMKDSAMKEITIAHLLNINHENLNKVIRKYRERNGRTWEEWDHKPRYTLSNVGDTVKIAATPEWLGYALVKAAWKYEPGYAEAMVGKPNEKLLVNWPEEKEALLASLADTTKDGHLTYIINAGFFTEFILYEMAAKKNPTLMLLLPRELFDRVVEYVDKFH